MFKLILVPLDGSELSRSVLPAIEELAYKLEASLLLFHAINPLIASYPGIEVLAADDRFGQEQTRAAEKFLGHTAEELNSRGVPTAWLVSFGPAVDGIVNAAREKRADMIAMSTHGHTGVGRWLLGSVADAVLRRTHLPCLLLRPRQTA